MIKLFNRKKEEKTYLYCVGNVKFYNEIDALKYAIATQSTERIIKVEKK